jgi:hypothetical protein
MRCPKCGFEQEDAADCARCGIVFEKFQDPAAPRPGRAFATGMRPASFHVPILGTGLLRLVLLVGIGLFSISFLLKERLPDAGATRQDLLENPVQTPVHREPFQIESGEMVYTITPLYAYELSGLVVSDHDCGAWWDIYHRDQWKDFINVKDLCVLWGENVRTGVYRDMRFTSDSWTCTYYWPNEEVGSRFNHTQLSNNHLLSHDESVTRMLLKTSPGDQVRLRGYLAEYSHSGGEFRRGTSTVRTDTGNGACETVYVEEYEILKPGNPFWRAAFTVSGYVILASALLLLARFFLSPVTPSKRS